MLANPNPRSPHPGRLANDLSAIRPANAAFLRAPHQLLIDGQWVEAASGATLEVRDPSSHQVIATVAAADRVDVDKAVAAARRAFDDSEWSRMRPIDRERLLNRLADLIERDADELAELEAIDNGKSVAVARKVDIQGAIDDWRYMAGWPTKLEGQTLPVSCGATANQDYFAASLREPVGVVGAIIAWNFPLVLATAKVAPALAAGCTVVLKPAEETQRLSAPEDRAGFTRSGETRETRSRGGRFSAVSGILELGAALTAGVCD
jgi:phenylacetaldehyde dehydrogenase